MTHIDLATLQEEHPLRNLPLGEIGAEMRNLQMKSWRSVATWGIGKSTFNELSDTWTDFNVFRVSMVEAGKEGA